MKFYRQTDEKYKDMTLGDTDLRVGDFGCFTFSECNLFGATEEQLKHAITNPYFYDKNGLLYSDRLAKYLGGSRAEAVKWKNILSLDYTIYPCVAKVRTNYKYPEHFVVIREDGKINDPLNLKEKWSDLPDNYKILEYRLFNLPENNVVDQVMKSNSQLWNELHKLNKNFAKEVSRIQQELHENNNKLKTL